MPQIHLNSWINVNQCHYTATTWLDYLAGVTEMFLFNWLIKSWTCVYILAFRKHKFKYQFGSILLCFNIFSLQTFEVNTTLDNHYMLSRWDRFIVVSMKTSCFIFQIRKVMIATVLVLLNAWWVFVSYRKYSLDTSVSLNDLNHVWYENIVSSWYERSPFKYSYQTLPETGHEVTGKTNLFCAPFHILG